MPKYDDARALPLNHEPHLLDDRMRAALVAALEEGEKARAAYSVSAHIWMTAVLTDRALLLVKGAVRAKVTRMPLPFELLREPRGTRKGVRIRTPLGTKTLWGSMLDPNAVLLVASQAQGDAAGTTRHASQRVDEGRTAVPGGVPTAQPETSICGEDAGPDPEVKLSRRERAEARRRAGKKPRKPRLKRVRAPWTGFPPSATIHDISYHCVKCGRALTNPNSQRHRVGTECIKRYGSQARMIPNPAHAEWRARKARADADRVARQVALNKEHARAMVAYQEQLAVWKLIRSGRSVQ